MSGPTTKAKIAATFATHLTTAPTVTDAALATVQDVRAAATAAGWTADEIVTATVATMQMLAEWVGEAARRDVAEVTS